MAPSGAHAFAMFRINHAERAVPQRDLTAAGGFINFNFYVIVGGIRHKHWAAQFQQAWRLDDLYKAPEVSDAVAAVAIPAAARFGFYLQFQRFPIGPRVFLPEPFKHGGKYLFGGRFDVDALFNV